MLLPKLLRLTVNQKVALVLEYLNSGESLRHIAHKYGISHKRLHYWVNQYKRGGAADFALKILHRKKLKPHLEEKIRLLKEKKPHLSVRQAGDILRNKGIPVSIKTIWSVWDRYGLTFTSGDDPLGYTAPRTPQMERVMSMVQSFINKKDYKHAAQILNALPRVPYTKLLLKIPQDYLELQRKLDWLWVMRGAIPWPQILHTAHSVRKKYEEMGYNFSTIRALYLEVVALEVIKDPITKLKILKLFAEKIRGIKAQSVRFLLYRQEAAVFATLGNISKALSIIRQCRRLAHSLRSAYYWEATGNLFTNVGDYKQASYCYRRGLKTPSLPGAREIFSLRVAHYGHATAGQYQRAQKMLRAARVLKKDSLFTSLYNFCTADIAFGRGDLDKARKHWLLALEKSTRVTRINFIFAAALGLAGYAMALDNKKEAVIYLKKYLPLLKKYKLHYEISTLQKLLGLPNQGVDELLKMRSFKTLSLMQNSARTLCVSDYRKAFSYAEQHGILGMFHRRIVFFPEIILRLIERGKKTDLPRSLLNIPIFNQNVPVYHIRFLGPEIFSKSAKYLRPVLTPKEKSFMIHFALRAGAPGKYLRVDDVLHNFWPHSKKPGGLMASLLVSIRKKIRLPGHLLRVVRVAGRSRLLNCGCYITTDYDDFEALLVQINTLIRGEEWYFASKEFLRAFSLIRGKPFQRMYDIWSDDMRQVVLNRLEKEISRFEKVCYKQKITHTEQRVLQKIKNLLI